MEYYFSVEWSKRHVPMQNNVFDLENGNKAEISVRNLTTMVLVFV
jgi:hypothetical protein